MITNAEVDDLSRDGQAKKTARLHTALDALTAIDPATLPAGDRDDREMLIDSIKGLDVETIRYWRSSLYVSRARLRNSDLETLCLLCPMDRLELKNINYCFQVPHE